MMSFLWTCILSMTVQSLATKVNWKLSTIREVFYNIFAFGISVIPLILMKTQKLVGNAGIYCWIQGKSNLVCFKNYNSRFSNFSFSRYRYFETFFF